MHNTNTTNVHNSKPLLQTFGIFIIILLLVVSATWWVTRNYYNNSEATDKAFLRMDSSLNIANNFLIQACSEDSVYVSSKSRQPGFGKILILYKLKIDSVLLIAREMHNYIQAIKLSLTSKPDAGSNNELANNSEQASKRKLISNEMAKSLYDSLNAYAHSLLNILPFGISYYKFTTPVDTSNPFSKNAEIWRKTYFDGFTQSATLSSLTELDYQVWLCANKITSIIRSQWSDDITEYLNIYKPLVSQNSMYFLRGQTLKISAGLGKYTSNIKPSITINGQQQPLDEAGVAEYKKVITSGKDGSIPIIITFTNPATGERTTVSQINSYYVLKSSKNK